MYNAVDTDTFAGLLILQAAPKYKARLPTNS